MNTAITRGNDAAPTRRGLAIPGGDNAAGAFDDGDQRDDVVWFEASLDDEIDETGGEQAIGVAVTTKARHAGFTANDIEALALKAVREKIGTGGHEDSIGQRGARADLDPADAAVWLAPG